MIEESDNSAKDILVSILTDKEKEVVFSDLGLVPPQKDDIGDTMSPKEYSIFFRILYNGNYLGAAFSQLALNTLSSTSFKDALVAGTPINTTISHKFGYRILKDSTDINKEIRELHDCGIIYNPNRPYFLCVMTKGDNDQNLKNTIKDIANISYKYSTRN
jgi:hypothetical protein